MYATSAVTLFDSDRRQKYGRALNLIPVQLVYNVYCEEALDINDMVPQVRHLVEMGGVPPSFEDSFRIDIHIYVRPMPMMTYRELLESRDPSNMNLFVYCDLAHELSLPEEYEEVNKDPSILCVDFDWPTPNSTQWRKLRAMIAVRVLQLLDRERNSWEQ